MVLFLYIIVSFVKENDPPTTLVPTNAHSELYKGYFNHLLCRHQQMNYFRIKIFKKTNAH